MSNRHRRRGFTLVELLVVIGIIAVVVGLLIPVVANVRRSGYVASTTNLMQTLTAAITNYQLAFRSYPGTLPNKAYDYGNGDMTPGFYFAPPNAPNYANFTQSEDLLLSLSGGFIANLAVPAGTPIKVDFDPAYLGKGPTNMNPLNPGKHAAFIGASAADISSSDAPLSADGELVLPFVRDSRAPEFMDKFPTPDHRPIIYLRANTTATNVGATATTPTIVSPGYNPNYHYNYKAMERYLGRYPDDTSKPRDLPAALDEAVVRYFTSEQSAGTAKYAGTYILIASGKDGVYGTEDDIIMGGGGGK